MPQSPGGTVSTSGPASPGGTGSRYGGASPGGTGPAARTGVRGREIAGRRVVPAQRIQAGATPSGAALDLGDECGSPAVERGHLGQQAPGHLAQVGVPTFLRAREHLDQRVIGGHLEGDRLAGGVEVGDERRDVLEGLFRGAEGPESIDEAGAVGGGRGALLPTWRPTAPSPVTSAAALNRATVSPRELQALMSPRVAKDRPSSARASAWATPTSPLRSCTRLMRAWTTAPDTSSR